MIDNYPLIRKVALTIAYDNGIVNRDHPEARYLDRCSAIMRQWHLNDLTSLESWLRSFNDLQDLDTLACGEHSEIEALEANAPRSVDDGFTKATYIFTQFFHEG